MQQRKMNLQESSWNWSKGGGMGNKGMQESQNFLSAKVVEVEVNCVIPIISNLRHKILHGYSLNM